MYVQLYHTYLRVFHFISTTSLSNTLLSGHKESCDCSPVRCWRVMSFFVFLCDALHMRLSAGLTHILLQVCWQLSLMQDAGCWISSNTQTGPDPLFLEPEDCNKESNHSDNLSVFLQLRSWLCVGMFSKRTIFCVSYMRIHVLMSLFIVTMKYGQWQWRPHN